MAPGPILLVESADDLRLAAEWGVGIVLPDDDLPSDVGFRELIAAKQPRPFLDVETAGERMSFFAGCRTPQPFYFVDAADAVGRDLSRAFLRINNDADLSPDAFRAAAVVVSDTGVLRKVKGLRGEYDLTPIFAEATSAEHAKDLFSLGVEGSILRFRVDPAEMEQLSAAVVSGIEQLPLQNESSFKLGIVAVQGEYRLQAQRFREAAARLDGALPRPVEIQFVRSPSDVDRCDTIVLVGGWSNLQTKLLQRTGLDRAIADFKERGGFVLGLCAGMILCRSRDGAMCEDRLRFRFVDMTIDNNVLNDELEVRLTHAVPEKYRTPSEWIPEIDLPVFSEAPVIVEHGPDVVPLAVTKNELIVGARQGRVMVMGYHNGPTVHDMFLEFSQGADHGGGR